jgi:type II secretory pathway pseudopilin PulG
MRKLFPSNRPALRSSSRGVSIVEALVSAAIAGALLVAIIQAFSGYEGAQARQESAVKAQLLAEEGIEALKLVRNTGWGNLSSIPPGATRYLYFSGTTWSVTTTPEIIDGIFYRSFSPASVSRDGSSNIVSSGGTNDPNTLLITTSVSWSSSIGTSTYSYADYFLNY